MDDLNQRYKDFFRVNIAYKLTEEFGKYSRFSKARLVGIIIAFSIFFLYMLSLDIIFCVSLGLARTLPDFFLLLFMLVLITFLLIWECMIHWRNGSFRKLIIASRLDVSRYVSLSSPSLKWVLYIGMMILLLVGAIIPTSLLLLVIPLPWSIIISIINFIPQLFFFFGFWATLYTFDLNEYGRFLFSTYEFAVRFQWRKNYGALKLVDRIDEMLHADKLRLPSKKKEELKEEISRILDFGTEEERTSFFPLLGSATTLEEFRDITENRTCEKRLGFLYPCLVSFYSTKEKIRTHHDLTRFLQDYFETPLITLEKSLWKRFASLPWISIILGIIIQFILGIIIPMILKFFGL